jgi:CRISPR-associated protein (TIGR02710 family)
MAKALIRSIINLFKKIIYEKRRKQMAKTLILSVGGSLKPLLFSINHHCPENIVFFASVDTEPQITEILRQIDLRTVKNFEKIITPSAENIGECLKSIILKLPEIINRWQIGPEDIVVDYTGGTKSMSAALVLGTIEYTHCFSYIGGEKRNKEGVGTVIDGQEKVLILNNPWDQLAIGEKKKISTLFNLGRYLSAKEESQEAAKKVSSPERSLFNILKDLSEAYYKWDMFDYIGAVHSLQKARHGLEIFCSHPEAHAHFISLLTQVKENEKFLNSIKNINEEKMEMLNFFLFDVLANARRRAKQENRYDDAIIRLYRALELRAQMELKKYGFEASDIKTELLPEKIRNEISSKYFNERKGKVEAPLYACYQIIKAIEENNGEKAIGHRFFECYEQLISPIIDFRNRCIIVHGREKIDEEKFSLAWQNLIKFLEVDEASLPEFPQLKF